MRRPVLLLLALMLAASMVGNVTSRALATTPPFTVELPGFNSFSSMAVGDHCVFVDGSSGPLMVVDRDTLAVTATIAGEPSYDLLAHGDDVFVSGIADASIDRLTFTADCTQYTLTNYPEAPLVGAQPKLAWAGGTLWFMAGHNSGPAFGEVDLGTKTVSPFDVPSATGVVALRTDPGQPDRLWSFGTRIRSFDLVGGTPEPTATSRSVSGLISWAPARDGANVFAFRSAGVQTFDGATLALVAQKYPVSTDIASGDVDPARDHIAALRSSTGLPATLSLWSSSTQALLVDQRLPTTDIPVQDGLRFSPDGSNIFAVTQDSFGTHALWKLPGNPKSADLTMGGHSTITYGQDVALTVDLPQAVGSTDDAIRIFAKPAGEPEKLIAEGSIADGTFRYTTTPKKNTRYTAAWDGDDRYLPAESVRSVRVRMRATTKLAGFYAISHGYRLYHPGATPLYGVTVAPNHAGLSVTFAVQRRSGSGDWKVVGTRDVALNARSAAKVRIKGGEVGYRYRVSVDVVSDADHLSANVPWSYFRFA